MPVNILKCQSLDLSSPALARIAGVKQLLCDRLQYADDERCVHIYANLAGPATGGNLIVAVAGATQTLPAASNRLGLIVDISSLAPGDYSITCHLEGNPAQETSFTKLAASDRTNSNRSSEIPDDGIPLRIAEIRWPGDYVPALGTHALVPLPRKNPRVSVDQLRVYEDSKIIPSQTEIVGTWDGLGTPQWLHVFFTAKWDHGVPRQYRLRATGAPQPANRIAVDDTPGEVTITSSQARVAIGRSFAGIRINGAEPAAQHVVDEHSRRWTMGRDASVVVESQGAALAVVKITGTFRDADDVAGPWRFTTRLRVSADSPLIRVQHSFQWIGSAVDAPRIADLAFRIPCRGASKYALGLEGKSFAAPLPAAGSAFVHQERDDRVTGNVRGQRCDGWFCLATEGTRGMTLLVKEFWQRFPQEVEFGNDWFALHSWPLHGRDDTYSTAEQLSPQNFHRGLCFHSGRLLTLKWPQAYADTFNAKYRNETDPGWDAAPQMMSAKVPALSFTTEFAILPTTDDPAAWNALFSQNPLAIPPGSWLETAQPMTSGPIAAQGTDFPEIEAAIKRAVIGFYNLGQLSNFTGKFNYGDTHHAWVLPEDRPSAYRTCYSNHYYSVTTIFTLFLRSGDADLLALGRRVLDHAVSVDAIRDTNYAGFYHKGIYHWAGPTEPNGHHPDLEGILLGALVADDRYALDGYKLWLTYFWKVLYCELAGRERDAHCDLIRLVHLFQQEWDVRVLPAMRALAANLMQIPFAKQTTATWHPTWMSDYWRFTRDPAMAAYLVANTGVYNPGHDDGVGAENRQGLCPGTTAAHWHLACQEITGDNTFSTRHLPVYDQLRYATVVAPGTAYDGYLALAGESGEGLRTLVWPYLLHSLRQLGVTEAPTLNYGCYPVVDSAFGFNDPRRIVIYILKTIDEAWTINLDNDGRNQDSGGVLQIFSPRGRPISPYTTVAAATGDGTILKWIAGPKFDSPWVFRSTSLCVDDAYAAAANYGVASVDSPTQITLTTPAPLGRHRIDFYDHGVGGEGNVAYCRPRFAGSRRVHRIPADRELGLYRAVWGGGPCGMLAPLSVRADEKSHWPEAALIPAGSIAYWGCTQGWLSSIVGAGGSLVFTATEHAATVIVKDSLGNVLLKTAMLATPRAERGLTKSATVVLSRNGPWHLQVLSDGFNSVTSHCDKALLFAPVRADAPAVLAALP
jgi:YetA-like protein